MLEYSSNQLASELQTQVSAGEVIGVHLNGGVDTIVSQVAIWKLGAVFVPLDPAYPAERLQHIVFDASISNIISHSLIEPIAEVDACYTFLDQITPSEPLEGLMRHTPNCDAYIIHTSGSTGKPKGVPIGQKELCAHILSMTKLLSFAEKEKVFSFASMNVDTALEQLWVGLLSGCEIHIKDSGLWSSDELLDYINHHSIHHTDLPPALTLQLLADEDDLNKFWQQTTLKTVVLGGEVFNPQIVRHWQRLSLENKCRLFNAYGPTETVITATLHQVSSHDLNYSSVPIGCAIGARELRVVDENGFNLPIGALGELWIGGELLSRGYLNRNQETKQRFVIKDGMNWYRTGDMVRCSFDGVYSYLGRIDEQVKLRGYRIELQEIEAQINRCESVKESAVVLGQLTSGDKGLVAYIVTHNQQSDTVKVNEYLQQTLPSYMLPSAYVCLNELPLLPNGKINKKYLTSLQQTSQLSHQPYVAPVNDNEAKLQEIWAEAFGIPKEQVSVTVSFIELGGHSLLAMKMMSKMKLLLSNDFTLPVLFSQPSIREICKNYPLVESTSLAQQPSTKKISAQASLIAIADKSEQLPLSLAQQQMWLASQLNDDQTAFTLPLNFQLSGNLSFEKLSESIQLLVELNEVLRSSYHQQDQGKEYVKVNSTPENILTYFDLSEINENEQHLQLSRLIKENNLFNFRRRKFTKSKMSFR
jgi:amino acid adenylation domain-containing protein